MKMRYDPTTNTMQKAFTIKEIFIDNNNWYRFVSKMESVNKPIRPVILQEVQKIMDCQDPSKGFALYSCNKCGETKRVLFTCKSRFCNCCGAKYSKDRALKISSKLLDGPHRHVVFTIPEQLRKYFAFDRSLLNLLFEAACNTITYCFNKRSKSEGYVPGMVCVLHTFGRDLKWNPHIHMILSEEAIGKSHIWKTFSHINYEGLRRSWQYCILNILSKYIKTPAFKHLVDTLYKNNTSGFYVNSPPVKNFSAGVVNYIVRYTGRPVLAQSRITDYDGKFVSFNYTPHGSDEIVTETISVFDFFKKLIIHIPDRYFVMIRYCGFYLRQNPMYKLYFCRLKRIDPFTFGYLQGIYKYWRKRIIYFFRSDPLKCTCGGYFELIEIFCSPRKIKYFFDCFPHSP